MNIRIFICGIIILLFTTCGVSKTKLSDSELKWVNVYDTGDTLIFRSDKGELDTSFIIRTAVYYPEYMPIEVHEKYLPQEGVIIYKNKNLEYHSDSSELLRITKKHHDKDTRLFIDYLYAKVIVVDLTTAEAEKYKHGKVYEFDTFHPKAAPNQPKKIFWHEDHGIIKYITHANVLWERINLSK
jgi:hypothetical protein